ncbi:type II secretion system protein [Massilia horti]|uniref:Type II secretion system protein n=1 Tax=Massilia horti TaxID=2562153 RepID=A0A4Y9T4B5_9BURK|nr:type II secretion system protein [Massilia horti]TFW34412.1 type II secretion system protein [Massilia horti]
MQRRPNNAGFTYLALLFFVAIAGVFAASVGMIWSTESQRGKEQLLIYVGGQYRKAIESYYEKTPGTVKQYPKDLNDLLYDKRQAGTVRHLRRSYIDPITDSADWGIVHAPDGGIMGVYSKSQKRPLKTNHLPVPIPISTPAETYSQWRFAFSPNSSK